MSEGDGGYWILTAGGNPNAMLLNSLPKPGAFQGWMSGKVFGKQPQEPVIALIKEGYEQSDPPVFKESPQLMTAEFYEALREAGVDNVDTYDAEIHSGDGSVRLRGYKAYNIVGLVRAADLGKTEFADDNPSRQIDASIRSLTVDESKTKGLKMFRLAESVDTILIHHSVKVALEARNFRGVQFTPPDEHIS
jgi:hypothetical protein